jgi:hypothetical protein
MFQLSDDNIALLQGDRYLAFLMLMSLRLALIGLTGLIKTSL